MRTANTPHSISILLIALVGMLISQGCLRTTDSTDCEQEPECVEDYSNEEHLAWYFFNEGTFWIYEDSISGTLDTLTVYESNLIISDDLFGFEWNAEFSSDQAVFGIYFIGPETSEHECPLSPECKCRILRSTTFSPSQGFLKDRAMLRFPHFVDDIVEHSCPEDVDGVGEVLTTFISDHYMFNGEQYLGSVTRDFDCGLFTPNGEFETVTWVRGLGFTRWQIGETKILKLVEANIE